MQEIGIGLIGRGLYGQSPCHSLSSARGGQFNTRFLRRGLEMVTAIQRREVSIRCDIQRRLWFCARAAARLANPSDGIRGRGG